MSVELPVRVHATTIAIEGSAAVIRGASGSGKSDLALRCMMTVPNSLVGGAVELVADDYTELFLDEGRLSARAPAEIAGLLEVRGIGLVPMKAVESANVSLIVDLVDASTIVRLPLDNTEAELIGYSFPVIRLDAKEASAAAKLLLALDYVRRHGQLPGAG